MLFSKALISNSLALIKEATLSSPLAGSDDSARCTAMVRASWFFCRFRELDDWADLSNVGFRFCPATWGDEAMVVESL